MEIKCDRYFEDYLRSLPDQKIIQFYHDIEFSHFPILVLNEYQRRFDPKNKKELLLKLEIQESLKNIRHELSKLASLGQTETSKLVKGRTAEAKMKGYEFSKKAVKKGREIGRQLEAKTSKSIAMGTERAKKIRPSPKKNLELVERLGKLKKSGLITAKEFQEKKKALLKKV